MIVPIALCDAVQDAKHFLEMHLQLFVFGALPNLLASTLIQHFAILQLESELFLQVPDLIRGLVVHSLLRLPMLLDHLRHQQEEVAQVIRCLSNS